jgi:hypothetical protein
VTYLARAAGQNQAVEHGFVLAIAGENDGGGNDR